MRKYLLFVICLVLLSGCGGVPESPHIYVVGIDCSSSFWSIKRVNEQRYSDMPRRQAQVIASRMQDLLNEISIIADSSNFITTKQVEGGSLRKTVDREGIRKELENTIDMMTVLGNATDQEGRAYAIKGISNNLETLKTALNKRNFIKLSSRTAGPVINEDVNPNSLQRIQQFMERIHAELAKFNYSVAIPVKPQALKETQGEISQLLSQINNALQTKNSIPLDSRWTERNVYGKIQVLNRSLYFIIRDEKTTLFKPTAHDIDTELRTMIASSTEGNWRLFSNVTDYRSFFQGSISEITNLLNSWGNFDRDIGVKLTFIIIGDGKHDPDGKYENSDEYDPQLLKDIAALFAQTGSDSFIPGLSWEAINSVDIVFCVPEKNYRTGILDNWTKQLQGPSLDKKIQVRYHMLENLKENGQFTENGIAKLLNE